MQQPPSEQWQQNTSWDSSTQWQHSEPLLPQYPQQMVPQQQQWQQQPFSPQQNTPLPSGLQQPPVRPSQTLSRITWILVGVAIGLVFGLIIGSSYGRSATTSTNTTTVQATEQPASQPTQIPTPTQPAATPTHTPTWVTTQTFTGNGAKKTGFFMVPDNWKLVWKCNPSSSYGGESNVQVFVYGSDNSLVDLAVNTICKAGNTGDSTDEHQGGQLYLDVNSEAA
jgi:hypothetical protein